MPPSARRPKQRRRRAAPGDSRKAGTQIIVRELLARLGVQVDQASFAKADYSLGTLVTRMKQLAGAYGLKKAYDFVQGQFEGIANTAMALEQLAQKTGMSTQALQELQYAAQQSGVDAGELQMALVHLSRSAQEAATVGGAAGAAFYRLGLQVRGADGKLKPTAQLLGELSDKFNSMPDGPEKTALSLELLSRSGADLIPLLNKGSAGLARFGVEARRTGSIMSDSLVKHGAELHAGMLRLHATLTGLTYAVLGPYVKALADSKRGLAAWVQTHRQLIALKVHQVVSAIGQAFHFAADMATRFTGAFALVAAAISFAFAPLTTFIALLALLAEDVYSYTQGRDSFTGRLIYAFEEMGKRIQAIGFFGFLKEELKSTLDALDEILTSWATGLPGKIYMRAMDALTGPIPGATMAGATGPDGFFAGAMRSAMTAVLGPAPSMTPQPVGGGSGGGSYSFSVVVNAPSGDGSAIAEVLEDRIGRMLREAAAH